MHLHIQEVVNYAESRFSAAIPKIAHGHTTVEQKKVMQATLKTELVTKFHYIIYLI